MGLGRRTVRGVLVDDSVYLFQFLAREREEARVQKEASDVATGQWELT